MSSGSAVDVHHQYSEVVEYFRSVGARDRKDVPMVPDSVNLWLGYPHWDVQPEVH